MANFGLPTAETGTDEESLANVQEAINRIVVLGQRRVHNGRDITEAALKDLREREADLLSRVASSPGSAVNYAKRMPPS
jgi:uncharacterized membrane-anchored protein